MLPSWMGLRSRRAPGTEAEAAPATAWGGRRQVNYTGKWGEPLVGYWTLGPCEGSNGCLHGTTKADVGVLPHWTCCGCTDVRSVFCRGHGGADSPAAAAAPPRAAAASASALQ